MQFWGFRGFLNLMGVFCLSLGAYAQDLSQDELRKENEILRKERDALLNETVQLKKKIAELQKEARNDLEASRLEIDVLKAKLDRLSDWLAEFQKTCKTPSSTNSKDGTSGQPSERVSLKPGEVVKGKVTETSDKSSLLELSIGSEDGLQTGQELECYRLGSPEAGSKNPPLYIGKVRIIRVTPKQSVAQYVPVRGLERRPMVGDEVASELLSK